MINSASTGRRCWPATSPLRDLTYGRFELGLGAGYVQEEAFAKVIALVGLQSL